MKKRILVLALAVTMFFGQTIFAATFDDISETKYYESIERLGKMGIVLGYNKGFNPKGILTKAEAATMLQRAFKMVDIPVRYSAETEALEKTFISTDTSVAKLESAVLPAAGDTLGKWSSSAVETMVEARVIPLKSNDNFAPNEKMTVKEYALALAKTLYGPEKNIDFIAKAIEDGAIPSDINVNDEPITREIAAYILDNIVGDSSNFKIITLFITSDIHGNMLAYKPNGSNMEVGSSSKINRMIDDFKKIQPNVLLLDGGDSPYNTNIANFFKGESSVDVMNAMEYDATALGNHDFDYKFDNLLKLAEKANYAMLSANTYNADGTYPNAFKPYIIKDIDGVKIAIIGLTDDESKLTTHYTNTEGIEFKDHMQAAKEVVAKVRPEADVVVALAHLHSHNKELPKQVSGIDVEVGGGNDEFGRPEIINGTLVVNPGGVGACVSQVNLNMYKGKLIGTTFNQIIINDTMADDTEVKGILDGYAAKLNEKMNEVIGQCGSDLPWSSQLVRSEESALANAVADSLKAYMDADIAFQNGGGVRAPLNKGDITINNIYGVLPFDNKVILVETKGKNVWDAIENGLMQYPETAGRFLQVSGLKYTFDGAKAPGNRLVSVVMDDGTPLDLDKTYKVVANDFMLGGGDGYAMLNILNKNAAQAKDVKLISETYDYLRDVFMKYIREHKNIDPKVEGRITIINPQKNDSKLN